MVVAWLRRMGQKLCKQDIPDKFLTPGSVPLEAAEVKRIRKLVIKGKLAPFYPGSDDTGESREHVECPICFLQFLCMNRSLCCGQKICSECFIKIRANSGGSYLGCSCPFCKSPGYTVELCGAKSEDEKKQEILEEQRLVEHRLRQQQEEPYAAPTDSIGIRTGEIESAEIDAQENTTSEVGEENQPPTSPPSNAESSPPPPVTVLVDRGTGTGSHDRGASSTGDGTPSAVIQEEYQRGYSVLSSSAHRSSGAPLSNTEMTQCAEYLGVFPEDLGVRVAEFNELLLEQAIISSMLENRSAQRTSNQATQDNAPQPARRPDTPRPDSDSLLDVDRLRWSMGPSHGGGDSISDDGWGGDTDRRPDTPRPPYSSVPDDQLAETVSWANEAVDPNWEFVNLIMGGGSSRTAPDGDDDESSSGRAPPPWDSAGPVGEGDSRESRAAEQEIGSSLLNSNFFQAIRRQGSCPGRLDRLTPVDGALGMISAGDGAQNVWFSSESSEESSVIPRTASMPYGRTQDFSRLWRNFIARLALDGEVDPESTTVHIGMVFLMENTQTPDENREVTGGREATQSDVGEGSQEGPSLQICERVRTDRRANDGGFETVAVTNPDGTLMLVSAPKQGEKLDQEKSGNEEDCMMSRAAKLHMELVMLDAEVREAIERGDQNASGSSSMGGGGSGNVMDNAIVEAVAKADEDWVQRMQRMDEELKKALQHK